MSLALRPAYRSNARALSGATRILGISSKCFGTRLVTVTGAGGVGKTQTAFGVGEAHLENTKTEVWVVELAPVQESFLASAVAQVLRVQESANRPLLETLVANLKQKSLLLILGSSTTASTSLRRLPGWPGRC